jgi:hypothetical protein
VFDRLRPHARGLHQREIGAGGEGDEVAGAVESVVLADARYHGGLGIGRHPHALRLGEAERI